MKSIQKGFTLIELVVVIVILGILAATAIPAFIDLEAEAGEAAAEGVAGALASASAINYAASLTDAAHTPVTECADVAALLAGGAMPTGFTNGGAATALASGASGTCTVTHTDSAATADYTIIGAP